MTTTSIKTLIVVSGLPGTGKTQIAEALAKQFEIPVFAKDWLEAALLRCGFSENFATDKLGFAGYELLTTLASRQLALGQAVILDSVASVQKLRKKWYELAIEHDAKWCVIECVCSDEEIHRSRLEGRNRGIPGWHELTWEEVERVRAYYPDWEEDRLVLDSVNNLSQNVHRAVDYITLG